MGACPVLSKPAAAETAPVAPASQEGRARPRSAPIGRPPAGSRRPHPTHPTRLTSIGQSDMSRRARPEPDRRTARPQRRARPRQGVSSQTAGRRHMRYHGRRLVAVVTTLSFLFLMVGPGLAADPEIDRLLRSPVGKDWITNGGNLTNQRYSTLTQVNTTNVKQLKGAWMTRLKGSGSGGKYSFEASPLIKDGIMYVVTGNDDVFALDAKSGAILWRWYTLPGPGEFGSDTWPPGTDHSMRGGATIWNTPALDPDLGLIYFVAGNCGPDYDGSMREGDNLFCASMIALKAKTGEYVWHFQQVHHDIWDYDAASPVVLFDTIIDGKPRKGIAEAGRTGWVYILDRTNGKPLIGIEERPVPQEPRQKTAKTQPIPLGDATVPQCAELLPGYEKAGCIFDTFWETPVLMQPSGIGGTNWSPVPYSPDTGYFYVPGTVRTSAFTRFGDKYQIGLRYVGGSQSAPIGSPMSGTFTAIDSKTNKIAWQHKTPYRIGGGGGSTVTAGGLVFRGEPDGNFLAIDAKTGQELWRFQTGFGADAPPVVYEVDGEQYIAIATGGNQLQGSAYGDAVWAFSLKGQLNPLWPPPLPQTVAGPTGPIVAGVDTIKMGGNNVEYGYVPARVRIKAGSTLTFVNVGDLPHTATAMEKRDWDTGALAKGGSTTVTFSQPGNYYYICLPHPWMYGQVVVE